MRKTALAERHPATRPAHRREESAALMTYHACADDMSASEIASSPLPAPPSLKNTSIKTTAARNNKREGAAAGGPRSGLRARAKIPPECTPSWKVRRDHVGISSELKVLKVQATTTSSDYARPPLQLTGGAALPLGKCRGIMSGISNNQASL